MDEVRLIKEEIRRLENNLRKYMEILPILDVSDKHTERVINNILDDINVRKKKLKELEQ